MITSEYNFGEITNRMLQRVSSNVDKRQGSIIYDAVSPVGLELAKTYLMLQAIEKEAFPDTASGHRHRHHGRKSKTNYSFFHNILLQFYAAMEYSNYLNEAIINFTPLIVNTKTT